MTRLIDADALKSYIDCGHLRPPTEVCFSELDVCNMIDKAPTEEADGDLISRAVQGEWIDEGMPTCSICGKWIDVLQGTAKLNYCPNCGARMKGGADE